MDSSRGRARARLHCRSFTGRTCLNLRSPFGMKSIFPCQSTACPTFGFRETRARAERCGSKGQLVLNNIALRLNRALAGPSASALETPLRPQDRACGGSVAGTSLIRQRRHWITAAERLSEQVVSVLRPQACLWASHASGLFPSISASLNPSAAARRGSPAVCRRTRQVSGRSRQT
jgi:hypothetical protein